MGLRKLIREYKRLLENRSLKSILRSKINNPDLLIYDDKYCIKKEKVAGFSQYGQDLFCFHNIFKSAKKGVFVDVGANHPKLSNNTYYLEKNGWSGIAFEPQEQFSGLWDVERKTKCLPYILGNENKVVNFIEASESAHHLFAGVEGFNKLGQSIKTKTTALMQRRLDEVLIENKIRQVDYLSIDVEGYEMNVLLGLDFSKIEIKCIDIENDIGKPYLGNCELRSYILDSGYRQIARLVGDDIFVKSRAF